MGGHSTKRNRNRRVALTIVLAAAAMPAAQALPDPPAAASPARPNILIILTDDQRASGTMSVMPATRRWFARQGTTFTNAFATTPLCCPSRSSIFCGRYAHNHGVQSNQRGAADILDQSTTMQVYLHHAGYRTAMVGKYFNAWDLSVNPEYFDHWAIESPNGPTGYSDGTWNVDGALRTVDKYSTDYIAGQGVRFIDSREPNDPQPWFLELATFAPHMPAVPAAKYADSSLPPFHLDPSMREEDVSDKPPFVNDRSRATQHGILATRATQLRSLMSVDDLVKQVFATLRRDGELRNTLAFFLSDNGILWGAHGIMGKQTPYTPSILLPFFARWPGQVAAGVTDKRFVANIDIAPTVLQAAGIAQDPAHPMDGRSLLDKTWARDRMLTEFWRIKHPSDVPTWASLRTPSLQYVEYYDASGNITFREYYDLETDPWELTNLLHDGRRTDDPAVAALHQQLTQDRTCAGAGCP